jgi:hypothetical protein
MNNGPAYDTETSASADKFALGAILRHHGFRLQDAPLLDAALAGSLNAISRMIVTEYLTVEETNLADAIKWFIDRHAASLEATGAALELERRRSRYINDRNAWLASEHIDPAAPWRRRQITKAQRFLIADMCRTLQCDVPVLENRGAAADWLEQNGAHPMLRPDDL